jgi:hypothetical protein
MQGQDTLKNFSYTTLDNISERLALDIPVGHGQVIMQGMK